MRDSIGCKEVSSKTDKFRTAFKAEYNVDASQTGSHVTVPFLPNEDTNGEGPRLTLEEFATPSFKVRFDSK